MKKLVKILALILCVAMLLSFTSCMQNEEGIPEGMINATAPGNDFRLYVPSTWTANTAYGVSGAYATLSQRSNVSMVKYTMTAERSSAMPEELKNSATASLERLEWFYQTECLPSIKNLASGTLVENVTEPTATLLDGNNARRYHQKGTVSGVELHFIHVITERMINNEGVFENAFYVMSFVIDSRLYENLRANVESILSAFVFGDVYYPKDYVKSLDSEQTPPEGMKLASNSEVAYYLYVPQDWEINREERIFSAYVASDRSSVSVIPYMPDVEMDIAGLWEMNKKAMINTAGDGFGELECDTSRVVNGKRCYTYRYFYTVNGQRYDYMQVILIHENMFYCITYTALPEHYYDHIDEFEQILANIEFR